MTGIAGSGVTVGALYDRAVRCGGERVALSQPGRDGWTYERLGIDARRLHAAWRALGVARHDRVALWMPNCCEYVLVEYSLARAGATRVPLARTSSDDDIVDAVCRTGCVALVYAGSLEARLGRLASRLATVRHFIRVGEGEGGAVRGDTSLRALIEAHPPEVQPGAAEPEDIAAICFTGGTTGRPKGVMLSHRALCETYRAAITELGIGWHERFLAVTPLTHASGYLTLPVLLRQGRCILVEQFQPGEFLDLVEREGATSTFLVPTMIGVLLERGDPAPRRGDSLANIIYGASAISPERLRQAMQRFGPVFTQLYGQTEAPMTIVVLPRHAHCEGAGPAADATLSSAGWVTLHSELRIVDEQGRDVPIGEAGEVVVRATNMMTGYWQDPDATAATIRAGWLHTGDVGSMDPSGRLTITDRMKDVIVSGGMNVSPREVEDVLLRHPGVEQAVVIGTPHDKWGEQVTAIVVRRAGCAVSEAELIALVKQSKGSVAAPKQVLFRPEVPLTSLGKLDRRRLRGEFWEGRTRSV